MTDRMVELIGNYRILRLLDRGGFAHVYQGEHIYLGTPVAIKILNATLTAVDKDRFLTEARTIAHLVHPHIVRVLDFGIHNAVPFLVMDYAPHGSLRQQHPKGTRLPVTTAVAYAEQIASALQYAHNHKLIHRDIKPENILLGPNHQLLLSDFGIAIAARSSLSQSTQDVIGTAAYMAPEQVQGKPRPASDQYALAILVYEWLCGEQPFRGSLTEIATQQLLANPPSLREQVPDIPLAVEQVLLKALTKAPELRYPTIEAFVDALKQVSQSTVEVFSRPTGPPSLLLHNSNLSTREANSSTTHKDHFKARSYEQPQGMPSNEKMPIWRLHKRQLPSMLAGVLLYTALSNLVLLIHLQPAGGSEVLWILPTLVIPLFFGAAYGPWVGLVTGGLGYFLGKFLSLAINWHADVRNEASFLMLTSLALPWYFYLAFTSLGLLASLSWLLTNGRYNTIRDLATAELSSIFAILLAFTMAFNNFWPHLYTYQTFWLDLTHIALPNILLALILLPILLILHNFINNKA